MACSNSKLHHQQPINGRQSLCESGCPSNSSSCTLPRRKVNNSIAASNLRKVYAPRATGNTVKERVLSAKMLKLRTLQNQLSDANFRLMEIAQENKMLKTLQKRQDRALVKYEASNADLPRLITSHQEEMRFLESKNKSMRKTIQDLTDQLKAKDEEVNTLKDQYKHLVTLSKDKHLAEREKLAEKVQELSERLAAAEATVSNLNRKLQIETKNAKHRLNAEVIKNKQNGKEMCAAMAEINRLSSLLEQREKLSGGPSSTRMSTFCGSGKRFSQTQMKSLASSRGSSKESNLRLESSSASSSQLHDPGSEAPSDAQTPETLKLEPISDANGEENAPKSARLFQKSPIDSSFRVRLSAKSHRSSVGSLDDGLHPLKADESSGDSGVFVSTTVNQTVEERIEKLSKTLQTIVRVSDSDNPKEAILGKYCTGLVSSAQLCNEVVNKHKEDLKNVQEDTEKILENIQEVDAMSEKLKKNKYPKIDFNEIDKIARMTPDIDRINRNDLNFITEERRVGGGRASAALLKDISKTVESDPVVTKEHKQKLLEALRAIDNGENVDLVTHPSKRKDKLMNDLFGNSRNLTGDL